MEFCPLVFFFLFQSPDIRTSHINLRAASQTPVGLFFSFSTSVVLLSGLQAWIVCVKLTDRRAQQLPLEFVWRASSSSGAFWKLPNHLKISPKPREKHMTITFGKGETGRGPPGGLLLYRSPTAAPDTSHCCGESFSIYSIARVFLFVFFLSLNLVNNWIHQPPNLTQISLKWNQRDIKGKTRAVTALQTFSPSIRRKTETLTGLFDIHLPTFTKKWTKKHTFWPFSEAIWQLSLRCD